MLNQAFINYGIAFLRARGYSVLQPPYMMKKEIMAGVAQLEQFDEELYKVYVYIYFFLLSIFSNFIQGLFCFIISKRADET